MGPKTRGGHDRRPPLAAGAGAPRSTAGHPRAHRPIPDCSGRRRPSMACRRRRTGATRPPIGGEEPGRAEPPHSSLRREGDHRRPGMGTNARADVAQTSSSVLVTLAAGQFLMTLDSSVMNVAIATVAEDVGTTVTGIQTAITLYTLVMAMLMVTGGKIGSM